MLRLVFILCVRWTISIRITNAIIINIVFVLVMGMDFTVVILHRFDCGVLAFDVGEFVVGAGDDGVLEGIVDFLLEFVLLADLVECVCVEAQVFELAAHYFGLLLDMLHVHRLHHTFILRQTIEVYLPLQVVVEWSNFTLYFFFDFLFETAIRIWVVISWAS